MYTAKCVLTFKMLYLKLLFFYTRHDCILLIIFLHNCVSVSTKRNAGKIESYIVPRKATIEHMGTHPTLKCSNLRKLHHRHFLPPLRNEKYKPANNLN